MRQVTIYVTVEGGLVQHVTGVPDVQVTCVAHRGVVHENAQHSIDVSLELAANIPGIRGDSIQLQQLLLNLIKNAIPDRVAGQRRFSPRKWKRCSIPYEGIIDPILATVLVCTRLL
jgi:hypothetical protein